MSDLVAWLREQIDEDERVARAVPLGFDLFDGTGIVVMSANTGSRSVTLPSSVAVFAARHDPARMLREVEAKRRLLQQFELRGRSVRAVVRPETGGVWDDLLRMLALPYADRPGYRDEWRP